MKRRLFVVRAVFLAALALADLTFAQARRPTPPADVARTFDVLEKSITELSKALASGEVTSRDLVELYLRRIDAYDQKGPRLNAILLVNPRAREEADILDRELRTRGPRGPLHGVPIVLKDLFDTADMPTTAGLIALAGSVPPDDGFQVRKLREAGAVILAKTNMQELAAGNINISSLGGQTLNPYDITRNPGGSSGGTGAAVAASFGAVGMGTDTCGSIRRPAAYNNLVGLRPTIGLSSRDGIVPRSHTQDVAGPMARTVEDLAIVLDATVGPDPADPTTALGMGKIQGTFTSYLDATGLRDVRIGLFEPLVGDQQEDQPVTRVFRDATRSMEQSGAKVAPVMVTDFAQLLQGATVTQFEMRVDLDKYLEETPGAQVRSMAEILRLGMYHVAIEQGLRTATSIPSTDTKEYRAALAKREVVRNTILKMMDDQQLIALAYPSERSTAAKIGESNRGSNCTLASVTGLPAISVPAGFTENGMPVGLEFLGRPFADAELVKLAYAYEQATHHRRPPHSTPSLLKPNVPLQYTLTATGAELVPGIDTTASAKALFDYDRATRRLKYVISLTGIKTDEILFTHLHRGEKGTRGPVVELLGGAGAPKLSGNVTLSASEANELVAGRLYLDVHTRRNLMGEVRAQLMLPIGGQTSGAQ